MLHLISEGDGVFRLTRGGRTVGEVRGASIRVGAFGTELEAMHAALRGERALGDYLHGGVSRRERHEKPADAGTVDDLRLVHDGAYEWIVRGQRLIARLIRPERHGPTSESSRATFALEFVAPSVVPSVLRGTLARLLVHALDAAPAERAAPATDPPTRPAA